MTADTEAGGRETTAAEGESSAAGSSCSAMMRDPTSGCGEVVEFAGARSSGSSQDRDHVRVTNVVDLGPGCAVFMLFVNNMDRLKESMTTWCHTLYNCACVKPC